MRTSGVDFRLNGIVIDLPPESVPPENWTGGGNVLFRNQGTKRADGYFLFGDPATAGARAVPGYAPQYLLPVVFSGIAYWIVIYHEIAGPGIQVWVTDGVTSFNITPATWTNQGAAGAYTGGVLNGVPFLNHATDGPVYWDLNTGNPMQTLPGWDPTWQCVAMRQSQYHLFAIGMTENSVYFPDRLRWSDAAEPGSVPDTWDPQPDNEAGDALLADGPGDLVDAMILRDNLVIYKSQSTYLAQYVAGQFVWEFRPLFHNSGIAGTNCVQEWNGRHFLLSDTDLIQHDGNTLQSVGLWKVRSFLSRSISPGQEGLTFMANDTESDDMWLGFSAQDEDVCNQAININCNTGELGVVELPGVRHMAAGIIGDTNINQTWDADTQAWDDDTTFWNEGAYSLTTPRMMMASHTNAELYQRGGSDNDGTPIEAYVERVGLHLQEPGAEMFWTQLWPRMDGQPGDVVNITVGGQTYYNEPVKWGTAMPYVIGQQDYVDIQMNDRLLSVRIESEGGAAWECRGFHIRGAPQGLY